MAANFKSKGVEFGSDLCDEAIYYAVKAGALASVTTYFELVAQKSYPPTARRSQAMSHLVHRANSFNHGIRPSSGAAVAKGWRRRDALRLLTGWESAGVPDRNELRKPSFATLQNHNAKGYSRYILRLAEMGANEALWWEWTHCSFSPAQYRDEGGITPSEAPNGKDAPQLNFDLDEGEEWPFSKPYLFIIAFLRAKDLVRAIQVADSVDNDQSGNDSPTIGEIDAGPESARVENVASRAKLRSMLLHHYRRQGLTDVTPSRLARDIMRVKELERSDVLYAIETLLGSDRTDSISSPSSSSSTGQGVAATMYNTRGITAPTIGEDL